MTRGEIAFAIVSGLLINEFCDVSPWIAVRLMRWAARLRYSDDLSRASTRSEELAALIKDRPGKLFKLLTAIGFSLDALLIVALRSTSGEIRRARILAFVLDLQLQAPGMIFATSTVCAGLASGVYGWIADDSWPVFAIGGFAGSAVIILLMFNVWEWVSNSPKGIAGFVTGGAGAFVVIGGALIFADRAMATAVGIGIVAGYAVLVGHVALGELTHRLYIEKGSYSEKTRSDTPFWR